MCRDQFGSLGRFSIFDTASITAITLTASRSRDERLLMGLVAYLDKNCMINADQMEKKSWSKLPIDYSGFQDSLADPV